MAEIQEQANLILKVKNRLLLFTKEWYGVNYLMFTPSRVILATAIIYFAGLLSFFYNSNGMFLSETNANDFQWGLYNDYITGFNIALIVITWYFAIYQWSTIHTNGDYGYWISLGVKREKFYVTVVAIFVMMIIIISLFGNLLIATLGGLDFEFIDHIVIFGIIIANIILLSGIAWVISELPLRIEVSSLLFMLPTISASFFIKDNGDIISKIFLPVFYLADYSLILNFVLPIIVGSGLLYLGYRLTLRREIEI